MTVERASVRLEAGEIGELLEQANLGTTARKLVDGLMDLARPQVLWLKEELDAMPVETAIRMGSEGKQRVRVKSCDGRWVGAGKDNYSALTSDQVLHWYSKVEVLNVGDGWNG